MRLEQAPAAAQQLDKSKSSNLGSSGPIEMKRYDKIPRTPIDPELLAQIHRDNVSLIINFCDKPYVYSWSFRRTTT